MSRTRTPQLWTAWALCLALVACTPASTAPSGSPSPTPTPPTPVRLLLGFRPDVQFAPFYLAQQAGYYAEEGVEVTIEHRSSEDLIRLVASGQAAMGVADATDVMISRTAGIPVRYVATLYESFPVALIGPRGQLPSVPAGLAGMTIGTPGRVGSSWHALLAFLDAGGLTADDVTIREYPAFNQAEGLLAGDVDLITGFRNNEPLHLDAAGMQTNLLAIDSVAPLPGPGLIVGDETLADDPDLVAAVVAATLRAQQEIADDPQVGLDAALQAVPTIGEDPETALAVLEATVPLWGGSQITGFVDLDLWERAYETMVRLALIDGSVPLGDMVAEP